jgi:cyclic dehypoxanthinyl futalosine synthase
MSKTPAFERAADKATSGDRIDYEEGLALLQNASLLSLASWANRKRMAMHPDPIVTFVVDRNINYTNVCMSGCRFCAFYCAENDPQAYVLSKAELKHKIEETLALGGTQILLQGGMHPRLDLEFYLDLLGFIKDNFEIHIHGFSPPEIAFMAKKSGLGIKEVIQKLMRAGLNSIPGGGAEILADDIRQKVSPHKGSAAEWLKVMHTAHELGLKTTATMMFGHMENQNHIIEHLLKIRDLQDLTGGFTAFIPWTFQPQHTDIDLQAATSVEYLKVLAVSRLMLDNVANLQASWVTQGDKIAQVALQFGANDFGSTMIEENVVAAAGVHYQLPKKDIIRLIKDAGYQPVQRDCFYRHIKIER